MHQHKPPACRRTLHKSLINAGGGKTRSSHRRALHKQDSNKYTPNSTRTASDQSVRLTPVHTTKADSLMDISIYLSIDMKLSFKTTPDLHYQPRAR